MSVNDRPTGTRVIFLRDFNYAKKGDVGTLVYPPWNDQKWNPNDQYQVDFIGYRIYVQRKDLKRAY